MSLQRNIAKEIQLLYPESIVKKIDHDNFLDIHIPHVNQKNGTHFFFNTSKGKIKIGFYCRDVAFVENAVRKSNTVEQYSQGIRLVGNPVYTEVNVAINAAVKLIEVLQNKPSAKKVTKKKGNTPKLATPNDNKPLSKAKKDQIKKKPSLPIIEKKAIKKTSEKKEVQLDGKSSTTQSAVIFNSDSSKPNMSLIYLFIIIVVLIFIGFVLLF
jgi:hypothetical protein